MGTLYVVATPIGNLEDVSQRALRVLGEASLLLAEDTRHTRRLLDRHAIDASPRSLHAHNEAARCREVLAQLDAGRDVALVSDAGTPLVSDPGGRLLAAVIAAGHPVVPVPGPSALLAALVGSGLPMERFTFLGFPPRRAGERARLFASLAERPETLVFFESPRRAAATLAELHRALGPRHACLARELTKRHEEFARAPLDELAERFREGLRGEVTLVVEGAPAPAGLSAEALDAAIRERLARGERPRQIAAALAPLGPASRSEVYGRALALREAGGA